MKLSSPEEMDDPPEVGSEKQSESVGKLSDRTVSLMGDEMGVVEAVELLGEMLDQPEAFDLVTGVQYRALEERVEELEEQNEKLAEMLERTWDLLERADSVEHIRPRNGDPNEAVE